MVYASLHDRLRGVMAHALQKELGVKNVHALPRLEKVIVNVGIHRSTLEGKESVEHIMDVLGRITGQKPAVRPSRKSIANFKIRKGMIVGVMVTLRGQRMEAFLDRLVSYVFPRIRDFRGLLPRCDGRGNYAVGLSDYSVFPEVPPPPDVRQLFGMQIQICIRARDDREGQALLRAMGFPFRTEQRHTEAPSS